MYAVVFPNKYASSWRATSTDETDDKGKPIKWFPVSTLVYALQGAYHSDAHFCPAVLVVEGKVWPHAPRINKTAYSRLEQLGTPTRLFAGVFDCDDPVAHEYNKQAEKTGAPKMDARREWRASFAQHFNAIDAHARDSFAWYESKAGFRLLCSLPYPLAPLQYQDWHARARTWFRSVGIEADESCKDAARLYRLPYVVRDGVPERRQLSVAQLSRPLPAEVMAEILAHEPSSTKRGADPNDPYADLDGALGDLAARITQNRNLVLTSLAGRLRNMGLDAAEIRANLRAVNLRRCEPPLDVAEVDRIAESIGKYDVSEELRGSDANPKRALPADPLIDSDVRFMLGSDVEIGTDILRHFEPTNAPRSVFDRGCLWLYQPARGVWSVVNPEAVRNQVRLLDGEWVATGEVSKDGRPKCKRLKVSGQLPKNVETTVYDLRTREGFFDAARPGFAFNNAFVTVENGQLRVEHHSPENRQIAGALYDFVPGIQPLRLIQFLRDVWRDNPDLRERVLFLQEFIGACMLGIAPKYERAVLFSGLMGSNGKSRLTKIVSALFPDSAVSAVPPQLFDNEYRRAVLAKSMLNVVAELPSGEITASETTKAVISGDRIDAREIRQKPFNFTPRCGQLFCCNRLPSVRDYSGGFWRKWVVLTFDRRFVDTDPGTDVNIAERIIATDLPAIAAWALEGAARLQAQGHYTLPPSSHDALSVWRTRTDAVLRWLEESCLVPDDRHTLTVAALYGQFDAWLMLNGHQKTTSATFVERLQSSGFRVHKGRAGTQVFARFEKL